MLAGLLALAIAVIRLFPETPLGCSLHHTLVELPIRLAHRIESKDIILVVIILCTGQTLALAGSIDLAMAYAVNMSIYADAALAASLAAVAARLKTAWQAIGAKLGRLATFISRPSPRARRTKAKVVRPDGSSNDNDLPWASARAA